MIIKEYKHYPCIFTVPGTADTEGKNGPENQALVLLRDLDFFESLSDEELSIIYHASELLHFNKNDKIICRGGAVKLLYILLEGSVSQAAEPGNRNAGIEMAILHAPDFFGDLVVPESDTQSVTVTAVEPVTVLVLSREKVMMLMKHDTLLWNRIALNLIKTMSQRLREKKDENIKLMQKQAGDLRMRREMMGYFFYALGLLGFYTISLRTLIDINGSSKDSTYFNSLFILLFGIMAGFTIKKTGLPLKFFGLTLSNWKKNIAEAVVWTILFIGAGTLLKYIFICCIAGYGETVMFYSIGDTIKNSVGSNGSYNILNIASVFILYIFFAPLQEIVVRSVLQGCLERYLAGRWRTVWAILASNFLFAVGHLHFSTGFTLLAFIGGLLWGILYARQRSIIGASISHILVGYWAFFILNLHGNS